MSQANTLPSTASDSPPPLQFQLTPAFSQFLRFQLRTLYRRARVLVWFAVLLLWLFLAAPYVLTWANQPTMMQRYWAMRNVLILPGILFVLMPIATYLQARSRWARAPELRERQIFRFSDSGIAVTGETFNGTVAWSHIARVERTGDLLLLITAQEIAYVLPLPALREQGVLEPLTDLIRRHVRDAGAAATLWR